MTAIAVSQVIERPPADVFRFVAVDHVHNHPRWDPNMSLEQVTPGPIDIGTVLRRSYAQEDQRVQGEMEFNEFEPDRALGAVIRDGPVQVRSRMTFEPTGEGHTLLTIHLEADVPAERMAEGPIQASLDRMKELIEAES